MRATSASSSSPKNSSSSNRHQNRSSSSRSNNNRSSSSSSSAKAAPAVAAAGNSSSPTTRKLPPPPPPPPAPRDSAVYFRQIEHAVRSDGGAAAYLAMSFLSSVLPLPARRPEVLKRSRKYDQRLSLMDVIRGKADDTTILQPHWPLEYPIAHIDAVRRTIVSNGAANKNNKKNNNNNNNKGNVSDDDEDDDDNDGVAAPGIRQQPVLIFCMRVLTTLRIPLHRIGLSETTLHFWGLLDPSDPLRDGWLFMPSSYDGANTERNKDADIFRYPTDHACLNLFVDWPASTFLQQADEDAGKDEGPAWLTGVSISMPSMQVLQECREDVYYGPNSKPGAATATPKRSAMAAAHLLSNNAPNNFIDPRSGGSSSAAAALAPLELPPSIEFVVKSAFSEWAVTWRARRAVVRTAMIEPDLAAAAALQQRSTAGGSASPTRRAINPLLELEGYTGQMNGTGSSSGGGSGSKGNGGSVGISVASANSKKYGTASVAAAATASSNATTSGGVGNNGNDHQNRNRRPAPDDYFQNTTDTAGGAVSAGSGAAGDDPLAGLTTASNLLRCDVDMNPFVSLASFVCARLRGLTDRCVSCGADLPGSVVRPTSCGTELCNYSASRYGRDFLSRLRRSSGAVAEFLILCAISAVATQREMLVPMCDVVVGEDGVEVVSTSPSAAAAAVAHSNSSRSRNAAAAAVGGGADGEHHDAAAGAAGFGTAAAAAFSGATYGRSSGFASGGLFGVQFAAPTFSAPSQHQTQQELQQRVVRASSAHRNRSLASNPVQSPLMDPQMHAHLQQQFSRAGIADLGLSGRSVSPLSAASPSVFPLMQSSSSSPSSPAMATAANSATATMIPTSAFPSPTASPQQHNSAIGSDDNTIAAAAAAAASENSSAGKKKKPPAHHFYKRDDDVGSGNGKDINLLHSTLTGLPPVPKMLAALRVISRTNSPAQTERLFLSWLTAECTHDEGRLLCGPLLRWLFTSMPGEIVLLPKTHVIPNCKSTIQFLVTGSDPEREARFQALKQREQERRRMAAENRSSANGRRNNNVGGGGDDEDQRIPDAKDDIFITGTKTRGSFFAWHGSGPNNWHSIVRNGLRNMSHTHLMSTGAIHGGGIYLARSLQLSLAYSLQPVAGWSKAEIIPHTSGVSVISLVEVVDWNAVSCKAPDPRLDKRFQRQHVPRSAIVGPTDPVQVHADGQIVTVLQSEYCMLRALIVYTDRTPRGLDHFELVIPKPLMEYMETQYRGQQKNTNDNFAKL